MTSKRLLVAALATIPSLPAFAQTAGGAVDAGAPVPALRYDSAFADYRRDEEVPRGDWREVNRVVAEAARQAGVHAGHGAADPGAAPGGINQGQMHHGHHGHHGQLDHGAHHGHGGRVK